MKKLYMGLDVHKASICIALAFEGREEARTYGKASSDLDGFVTTLQRILNKFHLEKTDVALCYE